MGFRFRQSVRLLPGVRLNLSKTGPSLSVGGRGLSLNLGKKGTRTTVGLPGSGMSYSSYRPYKGANDPAQENGKRGWLIFVVLLLVLVAVAAHFYS